MGVIRPPFYCSDTTIVKLFDKTLYLLYNYVTLLYKRTQ